MRKMGVLVLLVSAGLLGGAQEADARAQRVTQVPNGPAFSCGLCHTTPGGGPRNAFGMQVEATQSEPGAAGVADWAAIFEMDADGDGFTNGQELGDPEGTWAIGDPDPELVSDPNDAQSVPENGGDVNNGDNNGDTNNGDTNNGDTNNGDTNNGDTNNGDTNNGDANNGDANNGDANNGDGGDTGGDSGGDDDGGCSVTPGHTGGGALGSLLVLLGLALWRRRSA